MSKSRNSEYSHGLYCRNRADFDEAMDYIRWRAEQPALGIQETNEAAIAFSTKGGDELAKASGGTPQTARPYPYRARRLTEAISRAR